MKFYSATLNGVQPTAVEIEIDLTQDSLPFFEIVGLPDIILRESKTRVKSAIVQGGFVFPMDQRVVLNLAPSKLKKEGSSFELGLAARILASTGQITMPTSNTLFLGELALDGSVRSVPEIGALIYAADSMPEIETLVVPSELVNEFSRQVKVAVVGVSQLKDLSAPDWWVGAKPIGVQDNGALVENIQKESLAAFKERRFTPFWSRHLKIAALGKHHYFLCGPPGCGKTYFAESLRLLRQATTPNENLQSLKPLHAIFNRKPGEAPWAAPHHSATAAGLVGGGKPIRPGAVTRAHGGILFLDELLEFSGSVLDQLREPLEKGVVEIYRAGSQVSFPSQVQLVASTNPCRCGSYGSYLKRCLCGEKSRILYQRRMSGPFFDRFDVKTAVKPSLEPVRFIQGQEIVSELKEAFAFKKSCPKISWSTAAQKNFNQDISQGGIGMRSQQKIKKLCETIAYLNGTEEVGLGVLAEANKIHFLRDAGFS